MKKIITEVEGEGLTKLLGERVTLFCLSYFYNGILAGVNESCVLLREPKIIYETGDWKNKGWSDIQDMYIEELYVQVSAIEAFAKTK
jgi:hypothetical protein